MVQKLCVNLAVVSLLLGIPSLALAQDQNSASVRGQNQFSVDFPSGAHVRLQLCSSGVTVSGTDQAKIQVHLTARDSDDINDVRIAFKKKGDTGTLEIYGCPHNNFQIDLQIPKNSDLYARMFAGDLDIHGVTGNKDVQIHAGDLTLSLGNPSDYGSVDISVTTGDLDAAPYDVSKGGLFRSWSRKTTGKYSLYAHVGAGDLTLQ
jgi:hypothetical protein